MNKLKKMVLYELVKITIDITSMRKNFLIGINRQYEI